MIIIDSSRIRDIDIYYRSEKEKEIACNFFEKLGYKCRYPPILKKGVVYVTIDGYINCIPDQGFINDADNMPSLYSPKQAENIIML